MTARPSGEVHASLRRLWAHLHQQVDPYAAVEALVGLPLRTGRQVIGAAIAGSAEADQLLDALPSLIRNLSISTEAVPELCIGEIRGPIMWGETLSARASSAGDPAVFVCATTARAYDTPANRMLVTALSAIVRGGRDVERFRDAHDEEPALIVRARHNADLAQRFLDHRTLSTVPAEPVRARAARRVRADRRRHFASVTAMLERAAAPLELESIAIFCDLLTTARHDLVVAAIDHLERRGVRVPPLLVADHELVGGPIRFLHPGIASRTPAARAGLRVGRTRIDVPGGLDDEDDVVVVRNRADLTRALDAAIVGDQL